jgi:hypothetical protein
MPPPAPLHALAAAINQLAGGYHAVLEHRHGDHCVDVLRRRGRYNQLLATVWLRDDRLVSGPPTWPAGRWWTWPATDPEAAAARLLDAIEAA